MNESITCFLIRIYFLLKSLVNFHSKYIMLVILIPALKKKKSLLTLNKSLSSFSCRFHPVLGSPVSQMSP